MPADCVGRSDGDKPNTSQSVASWAAHSSGESACTENTVGMAVSLVDSGSLSWQKRP